MPITFMCLSCGKGYMVPDAMGGRRAKCKRCQAMTTVPTARQAEAAAADAWYEQEAQATIGAESVAEMPEAAGTPGGRTPPWVRRWLARLDRIRPRKLWAWAAVVIVVMLLVGLVNVWASISVMVVLGGLGAAALAVAITWGVLVALVLGSRVIVALLVAIPATLGFAGMVKLIRRAERSAERTAQRVSFEGVTFTQILIGLSVTFGLFAIAAGLISNPRAFKRPLHIGAVGALLLGVCWLPFMFHVRRAVAAEAERQPPGYAGPASAHRRPPGMPQGMQMPPGMQVPPEASGAASPRPRPADGRPSSERVTPRPVPPPAVYADTSSPASPVTRPARTNPAGAARLPAAAGDRVEVKWGGAWWTARVVNRERGWTQIEYESGRTREWVEPWRTRAVGTRADDIPVVHSNSTYAKPDAPAPADPPGPEPAR